jgi:hypothetical protein
MNEQIIKQLADQARQYAQDEQNNPLMIYTLDCFNKKFAELIVQECILACGSDCGTELIKQHFGVEE